MSKTSTYRQLFFSEGTTQEKRYLEDIKPDNVELMGFSVEDWMAFAYKFSQEVKFFNDKADLDNNGDSNLKPKAPYKTWESFFKKAEEIKAEATHYSEGDIEPHLTLFICFLKLLDHSRDRFNAITKRHLDFYYKEILDLKTKDFTADQVYTIFELAKNADQQVIAKDTALDAGKDNLGNPKTYKVEEETVINKTAIKLLRSSFQNQTGWYIAQEPKSSDGRGGEIESESQSWLPFGDTSYQNADFGFSIASPSLKMGEGPRQIIISLEFVDPIKITKSAEELTEIFSLKITGKSGWMPLTLTSENIKLSNSTPYKLEFSIELSDTDEPIINLSSEVHEVEYATQNPLIKFQFNNDTANLAKESFKVYKALAENTLKNIQISTLSLYSKSLKVINDTGNISTQNPFMPFGPLAKTQAKFKVSSAEWVGKNITQAEMQISWKDLPDNFATHYSSYTESTVNDGLWDENGSQIIKDAQGTDRFRVSPSVISENRRTQQDLMSSESSSSENETKPSKALFGDANTSRFKFFTENSGGYTPLVSDDYVLQLELNEDFFHDVYAKVVTAHAIEKKEAPNPPYTPLAENLSVAISTSENFNASNQQVQLFHDYPFGHMSQSNEGDTHLVQNLDPKGELYIGLEHCKPGDNVQFLFQLEEGTENPDAITAEGYSTIEWHFLYKNKWHAFDSNRLLKDETNNFLKTGLVKLTIPKEFDTRNTLMPKGLFWIRASQQSKISGQNLPDTVCRFIDIHPQAVKAVFQNENNDLSHLIDGLAKDSIAKLKNRLSTVKSVQQPYASFGGRQKESDTDFYRRVSERLRHKNRAVTHWDYEHLVLEKFTYLYKVKCLNHSTENCNQCPGNVLLVVVPNIKTQNVFDKYKPRLSVNKLTEIQSFLETKNALMVDTKVISPEYEPVKVSLEVKFHQGYDKNLYTQILKEDLTKILAPWAFDSEASIAFNNRLYSSEVIHFLEGLGYVDYIKNFSFSHNGKKKQEVSPGNEKSILTSVPVLKHDVQYITDSICTA